jgi:hypothetical protein
MARTIPLLIAALFALAAPAPATARMGQAAMLEQFEAMGQTFWAERGVAVCDDPVAHVTPLPEHVAGVQADGCRYWLSTTLVRQAVRERWRPGRSGDSNREELCATVFHELGHTAGLGHTETGLMSETSTVVPGDCEAWVARQVRAERRAARDRARGITRAGG